MDSDEPVTPAGESAVGRSYVSTRGILLMSVYVVALCAGLSYCLVALWPSNPPLAITSVKPNYGPAKGSTEVDVVGTGFAEGMQVFFGDVHAKAVIRKSDSLLTVTTPAENKVGLATIEIDSPSGEKTTLTNGFRFDPESKPEGKDTNATVTPAPALPTQALPAANTLPDCQKSSPPLFAWACSLNSTVRLLLIVVVVGALGSLIHVIRSFYWYVGNRNLKASWLLMYFLLPFNGAGLALLFFLIARGLSTQPLAIQSSVDGYAALAALVGMFSQQALIKLKKIAEGFFSTAEKGKDPATPSSTPKITAINPEEGKTSGETAVTVTGTGLTGVSRLTFGGVAAANLTVDSDTQITATAPAHAAGKVDVEVATAAGQKSSLSGAFTYVDPSAAEVKPVVELSLAGVKPVSGPASGGTPINITGNGFGPGASVKVGGTAATSVSVVSTGTISAVTPAGTVGPADVQVTNPDGKSVALPAGFQFS